METKPRPKTLSGHNYKLDLEHDHLFITINHLDDKPFEVFLWQGKGGSQTYGMAEALGRMVSLHLRRDTPVDEIVKQLDGIGEMQPWPNPWLGEGVMVKGIADGLAKCLQYFVEYHMSEIAEETLDELVEEPCPYWSMDSYGNTDCSEHITCNGTLVVYDPKILLSSPPPPPELPTRQVQQEFELDLPVWEDPPVDEEPPISEE